MKKALIALDESARGRRAGEYAAEILPALADCEILLLVLTTGVPGEAEATEPPPELHGDEDHHRERVRAEALAEEFAAMLQERGISRERLHRQIKPVRRGIAQDIVDEANAAVCDTIILGRSEASRVKEFFHGSISAEVLHKVKNQTVWVVA